MNWIKFLLSFLLTLMLLFFGSLFYRPVFQWINYNLFPARIADFRGYPWGSSSNEIVADLGSTKLDTATKKPVFSDGEIPGKMIRYSNRAIDGETGTVEFIFHPEDGLVKGLLYVTFGKERKCKEVFKNLKLMIQQKLGSIDPITQTNNKLDIKLCHAVLLNKAKKVSLWRDPHSSATVTLAMGLEKANTKQIVALVESPRYYDWLRQLESRSHN